MRHRFSALNDELKYSYHFTLCMLEPLYNGDVTAVFDSFLPSGHVRCL